MRARELLTASAIVLFLSFDLQAVQVGSIADSRFQTEAGWTLDGEFMTRTREKLLHPGNFGPEGTYPEAITITDLSGPIDYVALSNFDVFFIGYLDDDDPEAFEPWEIDEMQDWVADGGTMVITCDDLDHDAVCSAFGPVPSASSANEPVEPTPTGATRPVFNGPFGQPASLDMDGTRRFFDQTGGFQVLAEDQDGNPVVLEALIGLGRVIFFTDVDMISDFTLSEGTGIANDNDRFLGNIFAYLASEAVETFFINPGINGNWWAGLSRSGEGAQVEVIRSGEIVQIFLTFYSYNQAGEQIFLVAIGPTNGHQAEIDVYITEGGAWGSGFDPESVVETLFGTGVFSAFHCESTHLIITPNETYQMMGYEEVELDFTRLATPLGPCPLGLRN